MVELSRKYCIKTFGCAANEADSERLAALMEKKGYRLAKDIKDAGILVINTCSVRESAENRVFGLVDKIVKNQARRKKDQKLILTGCMVGSAEGKRQRYSLKQLKLRLPGVSEFKTIGELIGSEKIPPKHFKKKSALVPIMEGCNHFCTYCVVPYARGEETSRPFEEIVEEVKDLVNRGYQEVALIGQNVNSYGNDFSATYLKKLALKYHISIHKIQKPFALLLRVIHKFEGLQKISFLTSNPWDLTGDIIEAISLPKIDRYLHLPVQSGDDRILKKMNRSYTAVKYIKLIGMIRKRIPDIKIGTDIIVGFPGETKRQFENTVKLCQNIGFVKAYIAKYSPRPGTAAAKLKNNIRAAEKKRRWRVLENLINKRDN